MKPKKMKSLTLFFLICLTQGLLAQTFTEAPPAPFVGGGGSSIAFADVDGDGDSDVLITGSSQAVGPIAKLYTNDGLGRYTEVMGTPFEEVNASSIAFSDVDGDSDSDVLITGENSSGAPIAKLYTNDGQGTYTEMMGTPFEGVSLGSIAFSDVDGDGDSDVLIAGGDNAKLYTNNGVGIYTEVIGTPFEGVSFGSIAFSDVDVDGDSDVLIMGSNISGFSIAKLYTNDGQGMYTEVVGTPFVGESGGAVAFSDVDEDGDSDVLIAHGNSSKLYTNNGLGMYTEVIGTPFEGVFASSIAFSDVDGDGDSDVLITGLNSSIEQIAKLYTNDGQGTYTEMMDTPFEGVEHGSIAFSDVDGDGDSDVLITGFNGYSITKLYTNDGQGNYTEVKGTPYEGVLASSIAFSDVDGDGDSDVLITGQNSSFNRIAKLYANDGMGAYKELGTPFDGVERGSIAFSDVDGDGDADVLITGLNVFSLPIAKLYTNDGMGDYTEAMDTPFVGVYNSSIAFSDVDGDGDSDVLITGALGYAIAKLYTNDGTGIYTEVIGTPFEGVERGSIAFSDVDGDGDSDVLITGASGFGFLVAKLYTNDGTGMYTEVMGTPFEEVANSSIAFSDVDGDGDSDVLITGSNISGFSIAKLYTNDGQGGYTEVMGTPFEGVLASSIAFSDVGGDGDSDVLITGLADSGFLIAKLYTNDGMGTYTEVIGTPFEGVMDGSIAFSDVDGDGDSDVLITGQDSSFAPSAKLYTNDGRGTSALETLVPLPLTFVLSPNPSSGDRVSLSFEAKTMSQIQVTLFDINGRRLRWQQEQVYGGQNHIYLDISMLTKGIYVVQLDDGEAKGLKKLLIQ